MSPNPAASVKARLLKLAREQAVDFNLLLQRYAAERFLYRLSASSEVDNFTLKGAALFRIWSGQDLRPTRDVDFLRTGPADRNAVQAAMENICAVPCPEDGVTYDPATLRIDEIRDDQMYGGLRVRLNGSLGKARLTLQVDVGFGDVITPERTVQDYPTLVALPVPRLWTYPRETLVAEKFEAMVSLGAGNSRVKDLWDIACLAQRFEFDGETLRNAIDETFRRRNTVLANERPEALQPAYYEDALRAQRWQAFRQQVGADGPVRLVDAGEEIRRFLAPVCDGLIAGTTFTRVWPANGPDWKPAGYSLTGGEGDV